LLSVPGVVALPEQIDATSARLAGEELLAGASQGAAVVIADMTGTVFCDFRGIRHLLLARDRTAAAGAELRPVIESGAVLRILNVTGVDRLLNIYPGMQAAVTNDSAADSGPG
jgi:anti-anti-sigma factor